MTEIMHVRQVGPLLILFISLGATEAKEAGLRSVLRLTSTSAVILS
jgi:hypothetical protein